MGVHTVPYDLLLNASWNIETLIVRSSGKIKEQVLRDLAWFNKRTIRRAALNPDAVYTYVDLSCVSRETGLIEKTHSIRGMDLPERARIKAKTGDLLVPIVRPGQGAVAVVPPKLDGCLVTTGFAVLTPIHDNGEVLYFILRSEKVNADLEKMALGSIPSITLQDIKDYPLIKNISDQKVEEAARLHEEWRKMNALAGLKEIVDTAFSEKLGAVSVMPNQVKHGYCIMDYFKLDDALHPLSYLNPPDNFLRWSFPTERLGNVAALKLFGFTPAKHVYTEPRQSFINYIRSVNIQDDMLNLNVASNKSAYLEKGKIDNYERKKLSRHDLLIVTRGPSLGRCALVQDALAGAVINQNLSVIKCSERILPEYLICFLKTSWVKHYFKAMTSDLLRSHLPISLINELVVPLPPPDVQREVALAVLNHPAYQGRERVKEKIIHFTASLMDVQ